MKRKKSAFLRDLKEMCIRDRNHASDEHPWFLEAKKSRENPYRG